MRFPQATLGRWRLGLGARSMRSVIEYEGKAKEFDALAHDATDPALRKRYADVAACYRLLAVDCRESIRPPRAALLADEQKKPP